MKLSRISIGLAVRAARESAKLNLADLAAMVGMTTATLGRTETGLRDIDFAEMTAIAEAVKIDVPMLTEFAKTFEREGAAGKVEQMNQLQQEMNILQRKVIEAAIEART